jgi:hypothetical protein
MSRKLLQQALDALNTAMNAEGDVFGWQHNNVTDLIGAIETELANPEPEPIAWMHPTCHDCISTYQDSYTNGIPLYRREDV